MLIIIVHNALLVTQENSGFKHVLLQLLDHVDVTPDLLSPNYEDYRGRLQIMLISHRNWSCSHGTLSGKLKVLIIAQG